MEIKNSVFIICSVRNADDATRKKLVAYKQKLLSQGYTKVHLPHLDTKQDTRGYDICVQNTIENIAATETHILYDPASEGSHFDIGVLLVDVYFHPEKKVFVTEYFDQIISNHLQQLFDDKFGGYKDWIFKLKRMKKLDTIPIFYCPENPQTTHLELGMIFALSRFFPEKHIRVSQNKGIINQHGQYHILFGKSYGKMIVEWEDEQKKILM